MPINTDDFIAYRLMDSDLDVLAKRYADDMAASLVGEKLLFGDRFQQAGNWLISYGDGTFEFVPESMFDKLFKEIQ